MTLAQSFICDINDFASSTIRRSSVKAHHSHRTQTTKYQLHCFKITAASFYNAQQPAALRRLYNDSKTKNLYTRSLSQTTNVIGCTAPRAHQQHIETVEEKKNILSCPRDHVCMCVNMFMAAIPNNTKKNSNN